MRGVSPPSFHSKDALTLAMCLATIMQSWSLSPMKEPVHKDPCALVGDCGEPVNPIVGDGNAV